MAAPLTCGIVSVDAMKYWLKIASALRDEATFATVSLFACVSSKFRSVPPTFAVTRLKFCLTSDPVTAVLPSFFLIDTADMAFSTLFRLTVRVPALVVVPPLPVTVAAA